VVRQRGVRRITNLKSGSRRSGEKNCETKKSGVVIDEIRGVESGPPEMLAKEFELQTPIKRKKGTGSHFGEKVKRRIGGGKADSANRHARDGQGGFGKDPRAKSGLKRQKLT